MKLLITLFSPASYHSLPPKYKETMTVNKAERAKQVKKPGKLKIPRTKYKSFTKTETSQHSEITNKQYHSIK